MLHPWSCVTFFAAVPASWEPGDVRSHVENEARMVIGQRDHIIEQEYVRSGIIGDERVDHLFVTCVPTSVRELTPLLSNRSVQIRNSLSAVASLVLESSSGEGLSLLLGWYDHNVEATIVQDGEWLFGGYSAYREPQDCLYYVASLLERLGLNVLDLQRVLQYGSSVDLAPVGPLSQLFATQPSTLLPSSAFPNAHEAFLNEPAFVPCVGAVLKQLFAEV